MAVKTKEKVPYQEEVVIEGVSAEPTAVPAPVGTVAGAAMEAAELYAPDELEKHAQVMIDAWEARLREQTRVYGKRAMALAKGEGLEAAEPIGLPFLLPPYPWWNVILAGPFQPAPAPTPPFPGGPFLPGKIINAAEPAFMLAALWRNPFGINWTPTNPAAAVTMAAFNISVTLQTLNLTTAAAGPVFAPVPPLPVPIGGGFLNFMTIPMPPGAFGAPPQGTPHLYEGNLVADVVGPVAGLPFAGYATWVLDPDLEPPIFFLPFPPFTLPAQGPTYQYDIPARFMVYTA